MTRLQTIINKACKLRDILLKEDLSKMGAAKRNKYEKHREDLVNIINFYTENNYIEKTMLRLLEMIFRNYNLKLN